MVKLLVNLQTNVEIVDIDLRAERILKFRELNDYLQRMFETTNNFTFFLKDKQFQPEEHLPMNQLTLQMLICNLLNESANDRSRVSNEQPKSRKGLEGSSPAIHFHIRNFYFQCFDQSSIQKASQLPQNMAMLAKELPELVNQKQSPILHIQESDYQSKGIKPAPGKLAESRLEKRELDEFIQELNSTTGIPNPITLGNFNTHSHDKKNSASGSRQVHSIAYQFPQKQVKEQSITESQILAKDHKLTNKTSLDSNLFHNNLNKAEAAKAPLIKEHPPAEKNNLNYSLTKEYYVLSDKKPINELLSKISNTQKNKIDIEQELLQTSFSSSNEESENNDEDFDAENEELFMQKTKELKQKIADKASQKPVVPKPSEVIHAPKPRTNSVQEKHQKSLLQDKSELRSIANSQISQSAKLKIADQLEVTANKLNQWKDAFSTNAQKKPAFEIKDAEYEKIDFAHLATLNHLMKRLLLENKPAKFRLIERDEDVPSITQLLYGTIKLVASNDHITMEFSDPGIVKSFSPDKFYELWIIKNPSEDNDFGPKNFNKKIVDSAPVKQLHASQQSQSWPNEPKEAELSIGGISLSANKAPQGQIQSYAMPKKPAPKRTFEWSLADQVNHYYSEKNYPKDEFIRGHSNNLEKAMDISLLLTFPKIKRMTRDPKVLLRALQNYQNEPECNFELLGTQKIRRKGSA